MSGILNLIDRAATAVVGAGVQLVEAPGTQQAWEQAVLGLACSKIMTVFWIARSVATITASPVIELGWLCLKIVFLYDLHIAHNNADLCARNATQRPIYTGLPATRVQELLRCIDRVCEGTIFAKLVVSYVRIFYSPPRNAR